jgi:RHS repeat-associated protein
VLTGSRVEFRVGINPTVNVTTYAYDEANRLKTVVDPEESDSSYTYDKVGNRKSLRYPNGVVADYVYDARNRLTDLHNHVGESTISRHTYTHWGDGNRATLMDQDHRVTSYEYDTLNRLQEEKQVAAGGATLYDHKFVYDDVGNLLQKLDLTTSPPTVLTELAYNEADQISSTGFDYDDRGNMLSETRPETEEEWEYEYDTQNRLTHAYDGTNNFYYEYDGDGHRVKQTVNQIVTEFVVDLNGGLSQVVADINSGGNLKVLYVRGSDLLSQLQSSAWHWYSYDGHGSTIALTDDSGEQADLYEYDAWGNPLDTNEHPLNRFRYTGQEEDGTGLYYLRARYYGPRLGRFGSRDPFLGLDEDAPTLHRYAYTANNPVNRFDWSGSQFAVDVAIATTQGVYIDLGLGASTISVLKYVAAWALVDAASRIAQDAVLTHVLDRTLLDIADLCNAGALRVAKPAYLPMYFASLPFSISNIIAQAIYWVLLPLAIDFHAYGRTTQAGIHGFCKDLGIEVGSLPPKLQRPRNEAWCVVTAGRWSPFAWLFWGGIDVERDPMEVPGIYRCWRTVYPETVPFGKYESFRLPAGGIIGMLWYAASRVYKRIFP